MATPIFAPLSAAHAAIVQSLTDTHTSAPENYPSQWYAVLTGLGGDALVEYPEDQPVVIWIFRRFDRCDDLANRAIDAIWSHAASIAGMRERIIDYLEDRGRVSDKRWITSDDLKGALHALCDIGGAVLLDPNGSIEMQIDPNANALTDEAEAYRAARRGIRRLRDRRADNMLRGMLLAVGRRRNGFYVLDADALDAREKAADVAQAAAA